MSGRVGDIILVLRRAANITQEELAGYLNITQAALSRYENNLREPEPETFKKLSEALEVTADFLNHDFQMRGGLAADAHMRRQKTTKPAEWKRIEARLNMLRMHSSYLLERVQIDPKNHVLQIDPDEYTPEQAAIMLRAAWRTPIGAITDLTRWVESAGVIIVEEDFGTHRIDGMSQWAGDHAVVLLNRALTTDRKRLTLAHELGHLALHSQYLDTDAENQANRFAAEFLMPEHVIKPQLTNLTLGKLLDLKIEWGVSMQAIFERAYRMGKVSTQEREHFYRQMNSRGWKTREPGNDMIRVETPLLASTIGQKLNDSGLAWPEIQFLIGVRGEHKTPFNTPQRKLVAL